MVKKMKSADSTSSDAAGKAGLFDSRLAGSVKESAQQIWLAGMGAFAKAQEEGGKVFEALVREGLTLQKKTQAAAEEKIGEVSGRMSAMADTVSNKAGQNWDKLEALFEQRTAKALGRLGVPTAKDLAALTQRVDALAAAVATLSPPAATKTSRAAKTGAAMKTAAVKSAGKASPARAPAKKAVATKAPVNSAPARKAATKRARKTAAA